MRRALSLLLLLVLLVHGQQAAFVHALAHQAAHAAARGTDASPVQASAADHRAGESPADSGYCGKCFQFAPVASTASAVLAQCALVLAAAWALHAVVAAPAAFALPAARARGPPSAL